MAHNAAHESHTGLIWKVFGLLSLVTIIEVALGIIKPDFLHLTSVLGTSPLNWIFIILTLVKAYWIAWYFMHLKDEKKWFRRSIVWVAVFLILYLTVLVVFLEGSYMHKQVFTYFKWK